MSLLYRPLESITAADLQGLIDNRVRESLYIEYKTEVFDKRDKDKRTQFLGSVSAFANASGGDVLIGVVAKEGIPESLTGIDSSAVDGEILRIKAVLGSAIQPFMPAQFHAVPVSESRTVIIIRVPQSWNPPHGIANDGHYHFFKRHSAGRDPMTLDELRMSFTAGATVTERMRQFHESRIAWLKQPRTPGYHKKPAFVMHLIPFSGIMGISTADLSCSKRLFRRLSPIKRRGSTLQDGDLRYNADGPLVVPAGGNNWHTQLFRNGVLEHGGSAPYIETDGSPLVQAWGLQTTLVNILPRFLKIMESMGAGPPMALLASLINVAGVRLGMGEGYDSRPVSQYGIDREDVTLPEIAITALDESPTKILKPLFDGLWNAAGLDRCPYYKNGEWSIDESWLDDPNYSL